MSEDARPNGRVLVYRHSNTRDRLFRLPRGRSDVASVFVDQPEQELHTAVKTSARALLASERWIVWPDNLRDLASGPQDAARSFSGNEKEVCFRTRSVAPGFWIDIGEAFARRPIEGGRLTLTQVPRNIRWVGFLDSPSLHAECLERIGRPGGAFRLVLDAHHVESFPLCPSCDLFLRRLARRWQLVPLFALGSTVID